MFLNRVCCECGVVARKNRMHLVLRVTDSSDSTRHRHDWYCSWCRPNYDQVVFWSGVPRYYRDQVECDQDGDICCSGDES